MAPLQQDGKPELVRQVSAPFRNDRGFGCGAIYCAMNGAATDECN